MRPPLRVGHEHAALGEVTVGVHRGVTVEAGVEAAIGFGAVDAAGAEVGGDLRFILLPALNA